MIYIVGSGPSAVSAAFALGKAGRAVTILDCGLTLEPELQATVKQLGATGPDRWRPAQVAEVTAGVQAGRHGVAIKRSFSSDFPYRQASEALGLQQNGTDLLPSFALGGFSNVWGAATLPLHPADIADWPLKPDELDPHYAAVAEFMPIAGSRDGLAATFPLHGNPTELPLSSQAKELLRDLARIQLPSLIYGRSRLAVANGCRSCGLCMHGCPYGLIYNSADTVAWLRERFGIIYRPGIVVRAFEETNGGVQIRAEAGGQPVTFQGDALFIGAGVLATAKIVLESLPAFGRRIELRDSQYFFLPILRRKRAKGAAQEALHTLAQAFLELDDPAISPYRIHLQAYTYNPLYESAVRSTLGPAARVFPVGAVTERMLLLQGYLHSHHGQPIGLTLTRNGLTLDGQVAPGTREIVHRIARKLRPLGLALPATITRPGRGFHAGGTFPMSAAPTDFQCDTAGRLQGFNRVHLIDASVLPSVPATTITFPVMANAHRIGAQFNRAKPKPRLPVCLLTGANGYVGRTLAHHLNEHRIAVVPAVRRPSGAGRYYDLCEPIAREFFAGIDFLVHAAYDFHPRDRAGIWRINVEGSIRLLEAAASAGIQHGVVISSLSAFADCRSRYGQAKFAVERAALRLGYHVVRPGLVHGPAPGGMMASLRRLAGRGLIPLIDRGQQVQYLTHEEDLGVLVSSLLRRPADTPLCVTAACPAGLSMRAILQILRGPRPGRFLPVPWRAAWSALRLLETAGLESRLRSDSLIAMMHPDPAPDFSAAVRCGVSFRPFAPTASPS